MSTLALLALSTTTLAAAEPKHHLRSPLAFGKRATGGYYPSGTGFGTGTGTGYAKPTGGLSTGVLPPGSSSVSVGAPGATSTADAGAGGSTGCVAPVTVTVSNTLTVTVTASATDAGSGVSSQPAGPPYSIPGQSGPAGGPTASTGAASASALPTGALGVKRGLEMRGLEEEAKRGEKEKREGWWFA